MGDMNCPFTFIENTISTLAEQGIKLKDTCTTSFQGTFHWWTGFAFFRLDYIFIDPDYEVKEYTILKKDFNGKYPSDHYPIIVQFAPLTK